MASKSKVYFFFDNVKFSFQGRNRVKKSIERIFRSEKVTLQRLNYIFCSDEKLLKINREYLKHDDYTDIISFNFSDPGEPVTGEIYISVDRVKDNAKHMNLFFKNELSRVIIHGALHLCGYRDKTKMEKENMRSREDFYLNRVEP